MKMFKIYALAVVSLLMMSVACGGNDEPVGPTRPTYEGEELGDISKSWKLVSVNGVEPEFTVYVEFFDGIFYMYQQIYDLNYVAYEGNYSVEWNILSGVYADGTAWKSKYVGELSELGDVLTLTSKEVNPIVNVYEECDIPQEVIEEAEANTRSISGVERHF
ncbi:MAG: hypothetical protein IKW47_00565 [Alistipes sp.]|nr:hypothetical protein [Alistipes sp.]